MIESIQIKNFQSHANTNLSFVPGVNVVIGPTNSGKTAILRALDWVANNNAPKGSFTSWGKKETQVYIKIGKQKITRKRQGSNNLYTLGLDSDTQEFRAFRRDVPNEIKKILNFVDANFQRQMDQSFLLSASPVEVARYFNNAVNLDIIDTTISKIRKMKAYIDTKYGFIEEQINENESQLKEYENLDEIENKVNQIEQIEKEKNELDNDICDLESNIEIIIDLQNSQKQYKWTLFVEEKIDKLLVLSDYCSKNKSSIEELSNVISNHIELKNKCKSYVWTLSIEKDIDDLLILSEQHSNLDLNIQQLSNAINEHSILCQTKEKTKSMPSDDKINILLGIKKEFVVEKEQINEFSMAIKEMIGLKESLCQTKKRENILIKRFKDKFPNICPLCSQEVRK